MSWSVTRLGWSGVVLIAAAVTSAGSQEPVRPPLTINVRVVDSGAVAVGGAEVVVVQGLNDTRANGTTDARGLASLTISNPDGNYQIIVRKIGFLREAEFFHARPWPADLPDRDAAGRPIARAGRSQRERGRDEKELFHRRRRDREARRRVDRRDGHPQEASTRHDLRPVVLAAASRGCGDESTGAQMPDARASSRAAPVRSSPIPIRRWRRTSGSTACGSAASPPTPSAKPAVAECSRVCRRVPCRCFARYSPSTSSRSPTPTSSTPRSGSLTATARSTSC